MTTIFFDPEDTAEPVMSFVPIAATDPMVIKITKPAGSFYWSEVEAKAVAPSGDVTYYHSEASVQRVLEDLKARFPADASSFSVESATVLDDTTKSRAAAPPSEDEDEEVPPHHRALGVVEYDEDGYGVDEDGEPVQDEDGGVVMRPAKAAAGVAAATRLGVRVNHFPFRQEEAPVIVVSKGSALIAAFGEPGDGNGWQISTHWCVEFPSGNKGVIYEDRQSEQYEDGLLPVADIRGERAVSWSVSPAIVTEVRAKLGYPV